VTSSLPSFDEWLNSLLGECAKAAGEDVDSYVARAVASKMMSDHRGNNSPVVKELLDHLVESGVLSATALPNVSEVIADPDRLRALHATGLLDSPPEDVYDRITRAAADALNAPFAAVSLVDVDRQFFKSAIGVSGATAQERQTPLSQSVCQYAVANGEPLILEDARADPIFKDHPVVKVGLVVGYLGITIIDADGNAIGTLCVYDTKPRSWSAGHVQVLSDLAGLASERIFGSELNPRSR